jgi:hypothetical protein
MLRMFEMVFKCFQVFVRVFMTRLLQLLEGAREVM